MIRYRYLSWRNRDLTLYPIILYDITFTEDDLNTYRKVSRSFSFSYAFR
jgi:hypothetical protein